MGILIYEDEFCFLKNEPVDFQDMKDLGMKVEYIENKKGLIEGLTLNYSLDSELLTLKLELLGWKELFELVKDAYKDSKCQGCYLYYMKEKKKIECGKLPSEKENSDIKIIKEFENDKYECFNDLWDIVQASILVALKRTRPKIYLY